MRKLLRLPQHISLSQIGPAIRSLIVVYIVAAYFGIGEAPALAQASRSPALSQVNIVQMLDRRTPIALIESLVMTRGITFDVTPAIEAALKKSGATDKLIDLLRSLSTHATESDKRSSSNLGSNSEVSQVPSTVADKQMSPGALSVEAETFPDSSTKLMWTRTGYGHNLNWHQANKYCDDLIMASFSDWRLPSIRELRRLYNPAGHINASFQIEAPYTFWSSTREATDANREAPAASFFIFDQGKEYQEELSWSFAAALCVRGPMQ